jgi:hypothetical protein
MRVLDVCFLVCLRVLWARRIVDFLEAGGWVWEYSNWCSVLLWGCAVGEEADGLVGVLACRL